MFLGGGIKGVCDWSICADFSAFGQFLGICLAFALVYKKNVKGDLEGELCTNTKI